MLLPVILPVLFIAALFATLPFWGANRFFSMEVQPEWLASSDARRTRRIYLSSVALVTMLSAAAFALSETRHVTLFAMPLVAVLPLMGAWSWGWSRTLPHRIEHHIVRTASLRAQPVFPRGLAWTLAAILPLCWAALVLIRRYQTIPASFAIHFNIHGEVDHMVARSWPTVFGPLMLAATFVLFLAGLLLVVQKRSPGIADSGRYSALTGGLVAAATWVVTLEFTAASMLPLVLNPAPYARKIAASSSVVVVILLLVSAGLMIRYRSSMAAAQSATSANHWKGGLLYFNRDDAALFVPKRIGFGYTLNMARPAAWILMSIVAAMAFLPLLLKHR